MTTETLIHDRLTDTLTLTAYAPARYAKTFGLHTETVTLDGDQCVKFIDPNGQWVATAQVMSIGDTSTLHRL